MYEQSLGATGAQIDIEIKNVETERDVAQQQVATLQGQLATAVDLNVNLKATIEQKNILIAQQAAEIARLQGQIPPTLPFTDPAGWKTVTYDLFDEPSLDLTKWTAKIGGLGAPREEYNRAENIKTGSGLVITTKRESFGGKSWTSGYITSDNLMEFDINSFVEVKATLPPLWDNASGLWPCPLWVRWDGPAEADLWEAYGWPYLNPARTNATENARQRGNGAATTHNDTMATGSAAKRMVTQPANLNPTIADGSTHVWGFEFTDIGICYYLDGKPIADIYASSRPNPASWAQLASKGILKSNFSGKGHLRIQTQVGDSYWGPSGPKTASPVEMKVDYVRIMKKV
jgi:hypothetical protein